jgi:hypothetical protein
MSNRRGVQRKPQNVEPQNVTAAFQKELYVHRMSYQLPGEQLQRATGNITLIR